MINIDFSKLNSLETAINEKLIELSNIHSNIRILEAAEYCGCSSSKISKFVKKLGFENYKQYMNFLTNKAIAPAKESTEIERIKQFLNDFDTSLIDDFIKLIDEHDKIILFGYGPSFICSEYFEYKLRIVTNKTVIAVPDDLSVEKLIDNKSLLVIFSATGQFESFERIYTAAQEKKCNVLLIVEEYHSILLEKYDKIMFLSKSTQDPDLKPYEKSRTIFFIFIEEVIHQLIINKKKDESSLPSDNS